MSQLNYNIYLSEPTGDNGSGPYQAVVQKNPTTLASGGTAVVTLSNTVGTQNPVELISISQGYISDSIAAANQNDSLN